MGIYVEPLKDHIHPPEGSLFSGMFDDVESQRYTPL